MKSTKKKSYLLHLLLLWCKRVLLLFLSSCMILLIFFILFTAKCNGSETLQENLPYTVDMEEDNNVQLFTHALQYYANHHLLKKGGDNPGTE